MRLDYKWQAAIVVALALFMAILDNTIVNVALPQMAKAFGTDLQSIEWVATAYFLAQAAVIPVAGYVSDRIGMKTVFLFCLLLFTLGSGLCAIAPTKELLIGFRVLQGVGGGALFPLAFAIVFRAFPPAERGPAGAVVGVPVLLAPAFGPTIGGYLTTTFDWSAIFTVNVPIGIVALILGFVVLRGRAADHAASDTQPRAGQRFDVVGLLLSMLGFTALVYGITQAGTHGWNDTAFDHFTLFGATLDMSVTRYLALGGGLLAIFVVNELLVSDPVLDMRLFGNYTFTMSNVLLWAISAFLFGSLILIPFFFEGVRNYSPLSTGEILISQGLAAAVATVFAGRLYNRIGPRLMATVGFVLLTVGTIGLTQFDAHTTGLALQGWLVVRGLGLGLTNIPLQTLSLSVISNRAMARASSLANVLRQVAGALGIAGLTTYFVTQAKDYGQAMAAQVRAATQVAVQQQVQAATKAAVARFTSGSPTDPSTPLGQLVARCAAPFGATAPQHGAAIQACVQGQTQQYAQVFAQQYGQQHGPQLAAQYAAQYVQQHVTPIVAPHALNDTFLICLIATGICVALALVVGRDPAVEAHKRAAARGEVMVSERPVMVGE